MSILERLSQRVDDLLNRMEMLQEEIKKLQLENSALLTESQEKERQINALYEELASRDRGYEEIKEKIDRAIQ